MPVVVSEWSVPDSLIPSLANGAGIGGSVTETKTSFTDFLVKSGVAPAEAGKASDALVHRIVDALAHGASPETAIATARADIGGVIDHLVEAARNEGPPSLDLALAQGDPKALSHAAHDLGVDHLPPEAQKAAITAWQSALANGADPAHAREAALDKAQGMAKAMADANVDLGHGDALAAHLASGGPEAAAAIQDMTAGLPAAQAAAMMNGLTAALAGGASPAQALAIAGAAAGSARATGDSQGVPMSQADTLVAALAGSGGDIHSALAAAGLSGSGIDAFLHALAGNASSEGALAAGQAAQQAAEHAAAQAAAGVKGSALAAALATGGSEAAAALSGMGGDAGRDAFMNALGQALASGASLDQAMQSADSSASQATAAASAAAASSSSLVAALASGQNVQIALTAAGASGGESGQAFAAALSSALASGSSIEAAVHQASGAASAAETQLASSSAPTDAPASGPSASSLAQGPTGDQGAPAPASPAAPTTPAPTTGTSPATTSPTTHTADNNPPPVPQTPTTPDLPAVTPTPPPAATTTAGSSGSTAPPPSSPVVTPHTLTLSAATLSLIDTTAADSFANQTGSLAATDSQGGTVSYSLSGATTGAYTIGGVAYTARETGSYGTLYLNTGSGAYVYVPTSNATINDLGPGSYTDSFTLTAAAGDLSASAALTVNITGVYDTPVVTTPTALTYTDTTAADTFPNQSSTLGASDAEGGTMTYGISGGSSGYYASGAYDFSKTGSYGALWINSATGSYVYVPSNTAINALSPGSYSDSFTLTAAANGLTGSGTLAVSITGVNDSPVLATSASSGSYTEGGTAATVDSAVTVSDVDTTTQTSATITISSGFFTGDTLAATTSGTSITASYNSSTGVLTLSGSDTLADYQSVLSSVTFSSSSSNPTDYGTDTSRTISFETNDGQSLNSASNALASTVTVVGVNNAPVLATSASSGSYTEGGSAATVDSAVTVRDVDNLDLASATATISSGFFTGDTLAATTSGTSITASYNSSTGVLTLSGSDTLADYQSVLSSVTFSSSSSNPTDYGTDTSRTISFETNDGQANSNALANTVAVVGVNNAPVLATSSSSGSYTEGGTAATVDSAVTVSDVDNLDLASATATISSGFFTGDTLAATTSGTSITASYNSSTGVLTLSGSDTLADYQSVLSSVTFSSSSSDPTDGSTDTSRTISFKGSDGQTDSNALASTVAVAASLITPSVTNGSFETNSYAGWTVTGDTSFISVASDNPESGTYYLSAGTVGAVTYFSQTVTDTPGKLTALSFWLTSGNDGGNDISFTAAVNGTILQTVADGSFPSSWTEYTVTFTSTGSDTIDFGFRNDPAYISFDNVSMAYVADPPLPAVAENTVDPTGESVAALFSAANPAQVQIAGDYATADQGAWQYSTDGGAGWTDLATTPDVTLNGSDLLRFLPGADYSGAPGGLLAGLIATPGGAVTSYDVVSTSVTPGPAFAADNALVLDGSTKATVANAAALDPTAGLTLEAWVQLGAAGGSIVDNLSASGGYKLAVDAGGNLQLTIGNGGSTTTLASSGVNLADGGWHEVAATYDGGALHLYVDHSDVADLSGVSSSALGASSFASLILGDGLDGALNDVRIWSGAHSQSQIAAETSHSLTGGESGLAGYWSFDNASGDSFANLVTGAGTGTGSATVSATPTLLDLFNPSAGAAIQVAANAASYKGMILGTDASASQDSYAVADNGGPAHGSVSFTNNAFVYTPTSGHITQNDSFTVAVSDGSHTVDHQITIHPA